MCTCSTQANASTPGNVAAGNVPDSVHALNAAIDGMRMVMSIHAHWMLGTIDKIMESAESGIPRDYEEAISSYKDDIIWEKIKMDVHDHVCVLVAAESRVFDSLSLLCKASLWDEASERKTQVWEKHMTQHKLYTSSVRAIETILHKVKLLRTSQACQDHYNACLCINS